jgi:hypothetical protein
MSRLSILSAVIVAALLVGTGIILDATAPRIFTACSDRACQAK